METMRHWSKPVALLALALSAVGSVSAPVTAVPLTPTSLELNLIAQQQPAQQQPAQQQPAQQQPAQQEAQPAQAVPTQGTICRAAKQSIVVYEQPATTSQRLRVLPAGTRLTLIDLGSNGWVPISGPVAGFVQARDLTRCPGDQGDPQPGTNACRTTNVDLSVRQAPTTTSQLIGRVPAQQTVRLANPPQTQVDTTGRTWVRIVAPITGWVSSGFPEGNLGPRFNCR